MTHLNSFMSVLAVLGLVASAIGWRHSLRRYEYSAEFYFALAKVFYSVGIGARLLLWDVILGQLHEADPPAADAFWRAIGGTDANIFSSALILCGVYCSLRARHLLIPEEQRAGWPWWLSWQHSSFLGFGRRTGR